MTKLVATSNPNAAYGQGIRASEASQFRLEQSIRDYAEGSLKLFWQRHAMYFGAFVLAVAYYDFLVAVVCYWLILSTELFDHSIAKRVRAWSDHDALRARRYLRLIILGTAFNSLAIGAFIVSATYVEGTSSHFTPLLFLFSAALFAAMNAHQIFPALILRLSIYTLLFIFVALYNIVEVRPNIQSMHWLHFFTVIFVIYFIVDCSLVFLRMYRKNVSQIQELKLEHERAMSAYRAKSQFLSVVSHELRTPITSIKGPLNLICSGALGPVPDGVSKMLSIANKNSDRLAFLIDDLLDLQALDSGNMTMKFKTINLSKLVRDATEATSGYLRDKSVSVRIVNSSEGIAVRGDEKRLMQVMANLLSNAIKFSNDGGVVEVTLSRGATDAQLAVRDWGCGIPPNSEDKVFGEFSQIDSTDVRTTGGTGLGMSISKRIIHRHQGSISYESAPGGGTTFYVSLPLEGRGEPDMPSRSGVGSVELDIAFASERAPASEVS